MNTYILKGSYEGEVELRYKDGKLCFLEVRAEFADNQFTWFFNYLPLKESTLNDFVKHTKTMKLIPITQTIGFDDFWNRYDHKAVSSKKEARKVWDKLSPADRIGAYDYIPRYFNNLPGGVAKKYAETYLNSRIWNN